jgi:ketosteroid isomerase-like protein
MARPSPTKEDAMSTTTTTRFALEDFARATEQRDASTQVSMYAEGATVTVADRIHPPSSPRLLEGRAAIKGWIEEVTGRDMTHAVQQSVQGDGGAALTVACRYSDGTSVLCASVIDLEDGLISRQTVVQVWDER